VLFREEAEDVELPNSCVVVEVSFIEIPSTLDFESQMLQIEDVESPNSCAIVEMAWMRFHQL